MSRNVHAAIEAVEQSIGNWEPENAVDLDRFLSELPGLLEAVASSINRVAGRLGSEFPVHASVSEHLHDAASTIAGMTDYVAEAHAIHRAAHEKELERIESPRPNEQLWDVSKQ